MIIVAKIIKSTFLLCAVESSKYWWCPSAPIVAAAFSIFSSRQVLLAVLGYAVGTYGAMFVVYYYTKYLKLSLNITFKVVIVSSANSKEQPTLKRSLSFGVDITGSGYSLYLYTYRFVKDAATTPQKLLLY
jgi:hypothetical protein